MTGIIATASDFSLPAANAADGSAATTASPEVRRSLLVVGVGASAGGLEALRKLVHALPSDTGMAFVLVQHLAPTRESLLAEILAKSTAMPVAEVADRTLLRPDHVYVIPPGRDLTISGSLLLVRPRDDARVQHRPIDHFLCSLAEDRGHRAIGVILSGTASDGTIGLEKIKAAGGITFAQDDTAQHREMPKSAIAAGCVDLVLAPDAIASEIANIARHLSGTADGLPPDDTPAVDADLAAVLALLRGVTGVDFAHYKAQTIRRRITRRMVLRKAKSLGDYAGILQVDAAEVSALYQDILIGVTGFFRNPEMFETLKLERFPELFAQHAAGEPIRVWIVGCSSGEEAYSFAVTFAEYIEDTGSRVPAQIFATDLSETGIDKARAGLFSKTVTQDVSAERLRRFFVEVDGKYRVGKTIRDMCVFSRHNVLSDPPISHIDLLSCRNMLIYLEPVLQDRILPRLHFALNPGGLLVLGSSETIGSHRGLFDVDDARHKIYSRKPASESISLGLPAVATPVALAAPDPGAPLREGLDEGDVQREADRIVLERHAPAGVVINGGMEVLHFRGDTGPYLAPASGRASFHLLRMARHGLAVPLRALIAKARADGAPTRQDGLRVHSADGARVVNLEVVPLRMRAPTEERFLVIFVPAGATPASAAGTAGAVTSLLRSAFTRNGRAGRRRATDTDGESPEARCARLERELSAARDHLQAIVEQQDVVNAKLSAANERAQAANEELQSINEELATSQEEIQASNEELATVNDELNDRNLDVSKINNDLVNLIGGVQLPIVMLSPDLRIRRFSPRCEQVLGLAPADVGRPMGEVHLAIYIPDLGRMLSEVMQSGKVRECEVQDAQGRWFELRIRPYRTPEYAIDGVVMIMVDVDTIKRARAFAEGVVTTLREPLLVLDSQFRVRMASRAFYETFRTSPDRIENCLLHEIGDREWDIPELRRLLEVVLPENSFFDGFEVKREFKDIGLKTMLLNARQLVLGIDEPRMILLAIEDFTKHRQLEDDLQVRIDDLAEVDRSRTAFLSMLAHELRNPLAAIGSGLYVLSTPGATPDVLSHARDLASRQLRTMVRLTDDLLDVARVTRGKIQLQPDNLDLVEILSQAIELSQDAVAGRGQEVVRDFPAGPLRVQGDAVRLRQVFINLIDNASKYGKENGHIWIDLEADGRPGSHDVLIRVRDDGIGIDAGMLNRVFELFTQADTSLARSQGGLGIGLTLVRSLVEIHGGTIEAHSLGIGRGSEFTVRLPGLLADAPASAGVPDCAREFSAAPAGEPSRAVLVVDDNADASECIGMVLRLQGYDVTIVHDGKSALEAARTLRPAAILLDIGLPGIDGYEVMRRLRRQTTSSRTLVIAVSGYGEAEDRRKSSEAGFDRHLSKPVDLAVLGELLRAAIPPLDPVVPAPQPAAPVTP